MSKLKRGCGILALCLVAVLSTPMMADSGAIAAKSDAPKKDKKSMAKRMKSSVRKKIQGVKSDKQIQKELEKSQRYKETLAKKSSQKLDRLKAQETKSKEQAEKMSRARESLQ